MSSTNTVQMNGLTVEQRNGKVFVNGKMLTDEQLGTAWQEKMIWLMLGFLFGGLFMAWLLA